MEKTQNLKGLIIGASGSVGREIVQELIKSPNWSEVSVIVRRQLEEWSKFTEEEKKKLKVFPAESLDSLEDLSKWDFKGYSSVFCCLGSPTYQKETYVKVEKTYPINAAKLGVHFQIPHFGMLSGMGCKSDSWNFYLKTKGQAEDELKKLNIPYLTIFQPGSIIERKNNPKLVEKIAAWLPFGPKVKASDIAKAFRIEAELRHSQGSPQNPITYLNDDIQFVADNARYPDKIKS